jgi:hypothetical protein
MSSDESRFATVMRSLYLVAARVAVVAASPKFTLRNPQQMA